MADAQRINPLFTQRFFVIGAILFSGLCWYFSNGLSGDFWYLLWIAPVPILISSFNATGKAAFVISFVAYLIGRLSWFSYLVTVATVIPAIIFTVALPLVFAVIVILTRRIMLRINAWYTIFAFPVFFTTFEFLLIKFSPDGTAASIAYSQSDFLPVIQIASITGILGITFLVTFIPSAIAIGWYYRREKMKLQYVVSASALILIPIFIFGISRLSNDTEASTINVGLAVLDEKLHDVTEHPDFQKEKRLTEAYAKQIANLAAQGAELVVLPERAINITKETAADLIGILSNTARKNHVFIVTGYTNFRNAKARNSALVIDAEGHALVDYTKVHLVTGLESQFTPGSEVGLFNIHNTQVGTAICKDLDFPEYIKQYGINNVGVLFIPAWDFVVDNWLHSRMAILRGVENGFSEVRTARIGQLTISDCYGRVTYEVNCSDGRSATLLGKISPQKINTLYPHFPNWFGIVNVLAALFFVFHLLIPHSDL